MWSVPWSSIALAVGAGIAAGILVLIVQWAGQGIIDRYIEWPFEVEVKGLAPNPTNPRREARVRVFNRTSRVARVMARPLDERGQPINGWEVSDLWSGESPRGFVAINARNWTEFRIDSPLATDSSEPKSISLQASFFTLERRREKTYLVYFSYEFR